MEDFEKEIIRHLDDSSKRYDDTIKSVAKSITSIGSIFIIGIIILMVVLVGLLYMELHL